MKPRITHRFKVTPKAAAGLQEELKCRLETVRLLDLKTVQFVAGADVSYLRGDERMFAAVSVFTYPDMEPVESRWGSTPVGFPYVPGLLAFREAPALLSVFRRLTNEPDVILVDGHGIAHPRGFGIASHIGVLLGVPTVGVAKSVLVGEYEMPSEMKGSFAPLVYEGEMVGVALRTREEVKPVFVSVGNLIDIKSAARVTLSCCGRYRLPEPIRAAHRLSNEARAASA
jgi:deoxyribonuclease V